MTYRIWALVVLIATGLFANSTYAQQTVPGGSTTITPVGPAVQIQPQPYVPRFKTWKTNPGFYKPDYPIIFVSSYRDPDLYDTGNFGTDVLEVGIPESGQELWIMLTNGVAKKIFPIKGVHDTLVGEDLSLSNGRIKGAVTEPSISIDGTRVYFTFFPNAQDLPAFCCQTTGHSNFSGWAKGGDIYVTDLTNLLNNINYNPRNLITSRLTETPDGGKFDHAMNPDEAMNEGVFPAGVTYTGALEIDDANGRKLLFTSTRNLTGNSNRRMIRANKNYNLFTADIHESGGNYTIDNIKQAHYFTTSSAISPNRLRTGYAVSYQANTEDARQWHIQQIVGHKWTPLFAYGGGNELAHLGSFCVKSTASPALPAGDYELATRYYNLNNNGFGAIYAQPMSTLGINTYDNAVSNGNLVPEQYGAVKITSGIITGDEPSTLGKFTTPACGGPDEVFLAYDPGSANHGSQSYNPPDPYLPRIVFTDLEPANPVTQASAYKTVVEASTDLYAALWPKPVIDWSQRLTGTPHPTGDAQQNPPPTPIVAGFDAPRAAPHALLGTSALYNTDVTPVDCRSGDGYYDPNVMGDARVDSVYNNIANLSRLMAPGQGDINAQTGSCKMPEQSDIFGIAVYLTSNRIYEDGFSPSNRGYTTDNSANASYKESKKLLGVFKQGMHGQLDSSFKAKVPANVPLDFHLLDKNGAKLADVRSWHSLKPREERVDCGGCHNHRLNGSIPWAGTDSANPLTPAADMILSTGQIEYDAQCQPDVVVATNTATTDVPVWQDLMHEFNAHCGGCHEDSSTNSNARAALEYDETKMNDFNNQGVPETGNPLKSLFARNYIDQYNANGSPMFWAAYGERTDGRSNTRSEYQPFNGNYAACSDTDPKKCGYKYSSVHDNLDTCNGSSAVNANWVYRLSQWIDNHAPVNQMGNHGQYEEDRYHPTVESALVPDGLDCGVTPLSLDFRFWDDTGGISELTVSYNNNVLLHEDNNNLLLNDMFATFNLNGLDISGLTGVKIIVVAEDEAGNRQTHEKTIDELIQECEATL